MYIGITEVRKTAKLKAFCDLKMKEHTLKNDKSPTFHRYKAH